MDLEQVQQLPQGAGLPDPGPFVIEQAPVAPAAGDLNQNTRECKTCSKTLHFNFFVDICPFKSKATVYHVCQGCRAKAVDEIGKSGEANDPATFHAMVPVDQFFTKVVRSMPGFRALEPPAMVGVGFPAVHQPNNFGTRHGPKQLVVQPANNRLAAAQQNGSQNSGSQLHNREQHGGIPLRGSRHEFTAHYGIDQGNVAAQIQNHYQHASGRQQMNGYRGGIQLRSDRDQYSMQSNVDLGKVPAQLQTHHHPAGGQYQLNGQHGGTQQIFNEEELVSHQQGDNQQQFDKENSLDQDGSLRHMGQHSPQNGVMGQSNIDPGNSPYGNNTITTGHNAFPGEGMSTQSPTIQNDWNQRLQQPSMGTLMGSGLMDQQLYYEDENRVLMPNYSNLPVPNGMMGYNHKQQQSNMLDAVSAISASNGADGYEANKDFMTMPRNDVFSPGFGFTSNVPSDGGPDSHALASTESHDSPFMAIDVHGRGQATQGAFANAGGSQMLQARRQQHNRHDLQVQPQHRFQNEPQQVMGFPPSNSMGPQQAQMMRQKKMQNMPSMQRMQQMPSIPPMPSMSPMSPMPLQPAHHGLLATSHPGIYHGIHQNATQNGYVQQVHPTLSGPSNGQAHFPGGTLAMAMNGSNNGGSPHNIATPIHRMTRNNGVDRGRGISTPTSSFGSAVHENALGYAANSTYGINMLSANERNANFDSLNSWARGNNFRSNTPTIGHSQGVQLHLANQNDASFQPNRIRTPSDPQAQTLRPSLPYLQTTMAQSPTGSVIQQPFLGSVGFTPMAPNNTIGTPTQVNGQAALYGDAPVRVGEVADMNSNQTAQGDSGQPMTSNILNIARNHMKEKANNSTTNHNGDKQTPIAQPKAKGKRGRNSGSSASKSPMSTDGNPMTGPNVQTDEIETPTKSARKRKSSAGMAVSQKKQRKARNATETSPTATPTPVAQSPMMIDSTESVSEPITDAVARALLNHQGPESGSSTVAGQVTQRVAASVPATKTAAVGGPQSQPAPVSSSSNADTWKYIQLPGCPPPIYNGQGGIHDPPNRASASSASASTTAASSVRHSQPSAPAAVLKNTSAIATKASFKIQQPQGTAVTAAAGPSIQGESQIEELMPPKTPQQKSTEPGPYDSPLFTPADGIRGPPSSMSITVAPTEPATYTAEQQQAVGDAIEGFNHGMKHCPVLSRMPEEDLNMFRDERVKAAELGLSDGSGVIWTKAQPLLGAAYPESHMPILREETERLGAKPNGVDKPDSEDKNYEKLPQNSSTSLENTETDYEAIGEMAAYLSTVPGYGEGTDLEAMLEAELAAEAALGPAEFGDFALDFSADLQADLEAELAAGEVVPGDDESVVSEEE